MPQYAIYESVGKKSERVTNYRDLENHHPSKHLSEGGRVYARVNGEAEEILGNYHGKAVLTSGGEYMVSKDMVLTLPGVDAGKVPIPAPASGVIGMIDRANGIVTINDPKTGDTMFQIRHADVAAGLKAGDKVEYGQSLGMQHGYNKGNPHAFPDHVHFDVNVRYMAQADKWIRDMHSGVLTTEKRPHQAENSTNQRPSFEPLSGEFSRSVNPMSDGVLKREERGEAVTHLQQALNKAGIRDAEGKPLPTTGYFGEKTEAAVREFQRTHGLAVDGKAGHDTLNALGLLSPQKGQGKTLEGQTNTSQAQAATVQTGTAANPYGYGAENPLGNLIAHGEGGYNSYNRGVAGDAKGAQIDFSQMTVAEVMRRQALPSGDPDRLFAVGKYQFTPGTLKGAIDTTGVDPSAKFTPQLQEKLFADYLIDEKRPSVKAYITGAASGPAALESAQHALALEFASVGDPRKGGRGAYDGDSAGNKASTTPESVATALDAMRDQYAKNIKAGMSPDQAYRALNGDPDKFVQTSKAEPARSADPMADGVLKREERGDAVKHLQEALNKAGIRDADGKPLPTTGYFGEKTEAAVREYQRTHGLQVDGKAGHDTLTSLGLPTAQAAAEQKTTEQKAAEQKSAAAGAAQMSAAGEKPSVPPGQPDKLAQPSQADKPLISNPNHPDHRLYEQALSNLKQLGPSGGFKSDDERERAAAAVAADAKASGLKEITHISKSQAPNGESYLIAVQGDPTNPASKNAYLSYPQATQQTVEQSTRMAEATAPAQQAALQASQQQAQSQDARETSNRTAMGGR